MNAFLISALFGAAEMALLFALGFSIKQGNKRRMRLILFIAFISLAAAIGLLINKFSEYIVFCCCGFITGFPLCAVILYIAMTFFEDKIKGFISKKQK